VIELHALSHVSYHWLQCCVHIRIQLLYNYLRFGWVPIINSQLWEYIEIDVILTFGPKFLWSMVNINLSQYAVIMLPTTFDSNIELVDLHYRTIILIDLTFTLTLVIFASFISMLEETHWKTTTKIHSSFFSVLSSNVHNAS